jgi:proline racemase
VSGYYAAIEAGRYEDAWSHLSAAAHEQSPGFEDWRAGYATTVSQRVEDLDTEPGGVVRYVLVAVDRTPCGTTTERRFAVRWRLVRTGETTSATSLSGVKLAGLDPMAAC